MDKNKKIMVGVMKDALPYTTCEPKYSGLAVDIWENTAKKYNLDYEYVCLDRNYDNAINELHEGKIDVALADFSVIHRRFDLALFSRPN